jgi:hypothetical protein
MTAGLKGAILGGVQVAMLLSLGGKLLVDRATLPRIWVKAAPFDPNLPIRGRYVSLTVTAAARGFSRGDIYDGARFAVEDGVLVARPTQESGGVMVSFVNNATEATIAEPVVFFIPERVPDPSRRAKDEELWVELTVPYKGPPRPIRLGVKKAGVLTPLALD